MRWLPLLVLAACGLPHADSPAVAGPTPDSEKTVDCTVRVSPGEPIQPHLTDGAVVCLAPGEHDGGLVLAHSVTLRGEPGAVLHGRSRGPVVLVQKHQLEVRLEQLRITGGAHDLGSGVLVDGYSTVEIVNCDIEGNASGEGNGAGLAVRSGWVTVTDTHLAERDDVVLTTKAEVTLNNVRIDGDLTITDGAAVTITGGRVGGTLTMRGTTTRAPTVTLSGVDAANVANDPNLPATLTVQ